MEKTTKTGRRKVPAVEVAIFGVVVGVSVLGSTLFLRSGYSLPHNVQTAALFAIKDFAIVSALVLGFECRQQNPHPILWAFYIGSIFAIVDFVFWVFIAAIIRPSL